MACPICDEQIAQEEIEFHASSCGDGYYFIKFRKSDRCRLFIVKYSMVQIFASFFLVFQKMCCHILKMMLERGLQDQHAVILVKREEPLRQLQSMTHLDHHPVLTLSPVLVKISTFLLPLQLHCKTYLLHECVH